MVRKIRRHHSLSLIVPCFLLLFTMGCPKDGDKKPGLLGYSPPSSVTSLLLRLDTAASSDNLHNAIVAQGHPSCIASYWTGVVLLSNGRHSEAAQYLSRAQSEGLEPPLANFCLMALADIVFMGGDAATALSRYAGYILTEREPHLRFLLLARLAASAHAAGKKVEADNWLAILRTEFPHPAVSLTSPAVIYEKLKSETGSHNRVILQLGIFSSQERANSMVAKVAKAGLTARTGESNGMWVVYFGPYDDKAKAELDAAVFRSLGIHSYVKTWSGR